MHSKCSILAAAIIERVWGFFVFFFRKDRDTRDLDSTQVECYLPIVLSRAVLILEFFQIFKYSYIHIIRSYLGDETQV